MSSITRISLKKFSYLVVPESNLIAKSNFLAPLVAGGVGRVISSSATQYIPEEIGPKFYI